MMRALDGVVCPDAQHHGRSDRRRRGHGQREQRLADGDVHAGVDRVTGLGAEALQLVVLALKRRDDGQHATPRRARPTDSRLPCT